VSKLPVHNFIFQHIRRHCLNIYQVLEPASVSPSHRNLPPALPRQRSKMAYRSFVRREYQSFLRRIHGITSPHFADSWRYNKHQQFVCEFPLDVHLLRREIVRRNVPRIWRDFGSALPCQTRLTQTKPVLPLSNEHGSQVKDQGQRQCCHNKHKKFPIGLHVMYLYFPEAPRTNIANRSTGKHDADKRKN